MLFNSISYLFFLPIIVIIYFVIPNKHRWILLLFASYYFYMSWNVKFVFLILFTTIISYLTAILIHKSKSILHKKILLLLTIISSLGVLALFKYVDFFINITKSICTILNINEDFSYYNLLLPVGISFYTFQTLSYTIDVFKGSKTIEKHFGKYALYVSFFPQLVAGPIERSTNLMPQFSKVIIFNSSNFVKGLRLIIWGFFQKIVVADRLAIYVNTIYNNVENHNGFSFVLATFFFSFQIYCDFAGYSNIAIGSAKLLGYDLMTNFKRPYFSTTIKSFWQRWHISLSTWFRDYLYIPLGGNRNNKFRSGLNLLITFIVSGFWHGANWTFLIWGLLHGLFQLIEKNIKKRICYINIYSIISLILVFTCVSFAWIFFRANSLNEALFIIGSIFNNFGSLFIGDISVFIYSILSVLFLLIFEIFEEYNSGVSLLNSKNIYIRWISYIVLSILILSIGVYGESEFIYFQF